MAVATISSTDDDAEIAVQIRRVLIGGPLNNFREQLLDVIRDNGRDVLDYKEQDDDTDD